MKRIYHTWDKWECYRAGFYEERPKDESLTDDQCKELYTSFLRNTAQFESFLQRVITEWRYSCEHYLTNERMNRIAWLGQASMCMAHGIPAKYRGGFNMLSEEEQEAANSCALKYLNKWLVANGGDELTLEQAQSKTQVDLY